MFLNSKYKERLDYLYPKEEGLDLIRKYLSKYISIISDKYNLYDKEEYNRLSCIIGLLLEWYYDNCFCKDNIDEDYYNKFDLVEQAINILSNNYTYENLEIFVCELDINDFSLESRYLNEWLGIESYNSLLDYFKKENVYNKLCFQVNSYLSKEEIEDKLDSIKLFYNNEFLLDVDELPFIINKQDSINYENLYDKLVDFCNIEIPMYYVLYYLFILILENKISEYMKISFINPNISIEYKENKIIIEYRSIFDV